MSSIRQNIIKYFNASPVNNYFDQLYVSHIQYFDTIAVGWLSSHSDSTQYDIPLIIYEKETEKIYELPFIDFAFLPEWIALQKRNNKQVKW